MILLEKAVLADRCREVGLRVCGELPFATAQDCESGAEPDGWGDLRVQQEGAHGVQRGSGEFLHVVLQLGLVVVLRVLEGQSEGEIGLSPVVDCTAMDAGFGGRGCDGAPLRQRGDYLVLNGRQLRF